MTQLEAAIKKGNSRAANICHTLRPFQVGRHAHSASGLSRVPWLCSLECCVFLVLSLRHSCMGC